MRLLQNFEIAQNQKLRLKRVNFLKEVEIAKEHKYWKRFYKQFTNFLYDELNLFDNYVGRNIKLFKSFMNYLFYEKGLDHGNFHKSFYAPNDEIEIVVLTPKRLKFLISSSNIDELLSIELQKVKDIFVFGCTVGLRYSDLMRLTKLNLEKGRNGVYLKVLSRKTQTQTMIKLPNYALRILEKYTSERHLLPYFNKARLNKKLKELTEKVGFTEPVSKSRKKRGQLVCKNHPEKEITELRFCDLVTTHTMRRSAITILLTLGLPEQVVRQISGHSKSSREFFRYVSFSQVYLDSQMNSFYNRLIASDSN